MDEDLSWPGRPGPALLRRPEGTPRGGIVMLHGAADGRARQPLFDHLARVLVPLGVAVLSYDRRAVGSGDVPLDAQAADAVAAMHALDAELGCPVGVFGFSQGAWAASLAAADDLASFLVVLGCSGVSPAEQMRYFTDEALRRHGLGEADRTAARQLRFEVEEFLRSADRSEARHERIARRLAEAARQPWFRHASLPPVPPPAEARWDDMDHDPIPSFAAVRVPVLAMWGSDEECVPREASRRAWQDASPDVTLADLPCCGHWPVVGSSRPGYAGWTTDPLSDDVDRVLVGWLEDHLDQSRHSLQGAARRPGSI